MKFRKKPVVIDAIQWNGVNIRQVGEFINGLHSLENWKNCISPIGDWQIKTLEDGPNGEARHVASVGDWIIKGVKGEFYPCKPDIFEATYEPVE